MSGLARMARSHWRTALGAIAGAAGGAAYAHFIGCHAAGACALTSNVWTAGLFFGVTGAVIGAPGPRKPPAPVPQAPATVKPAENV